MTSHGTPADGAERQPDHPASEYLTTAEAAQRMNVSVRFIKHLITSDQLPVHRFGRSVRIKRSALDEVAESAARRPLRDTRSGSTNKRAGDGDHA